MLFSFRCDVRNGQIPEIKYLIGILCGHNSFIECDSVKVIQAADQAQKIRPARKAGLVDFR